MNLGFFASHGGSNMQAVIDATRRGLLSAQPALLISNNRGAQAVDRAQAVGMPVRVMNATTHPDPAALDEAMVAELCAHAVELVVLAGFMKKIGPRVLEEYGDRILNIHPSLLPKFGGRGMFGHHVHRAVLAAGETVTGITIHRVNGEYDEGGILAQTRVPVVGGDTVESLAARVLAREHAFLVEILGKIVRKEIVF